MADGTAALYHDDAPGEPRSVSVCIRNQIVFVEGAGVRRSTPLATVHISDAWQPPPRIIRFSDGARCEVADIRALAEMLGEVHAPQSPRGSQWEGMPRALTAVLAVILLVLIALYHFGVPMVARVVANQVPVSATEDISNAVVKSLDSETLAPSALPPTRQEGITGLFRRTVAPSSSIPFTLLFRGSPGLGANAMALPSGTIIVTDELVALARDDRELIGVLAHEAGHVVHRHSVRLVLQNSAVALFMVWAVGDFSSIIALAPATLLQAKYSRDFERDADAFAADLLVARGIRPGMLADLLERLEASHRGNTPSSTSTESSTASAESPGAPSLLDYTSSHPATSERLEYLRSR